MKLLKRLLAAGGAAGLLVGLGATPAFATSPFTATIELACANPDDTQTITVNSAANALIHIEVTIEGSTVNDGTKNGTGLTNANGTFTDQLQSGRLFWRSPGRPERSSPTTDGHHDY